MTVLFFSETLLLSCGCQLSLTFQRATCRKVHCNCKDTAHAVMLWQVAETARPVRRWQHQLNQFPQNCNGSHVVTLPWTSAVNRYEPVSSHSRWLIGCRCTLLSSSRCMWAASHTDTAPSCHAIANTGSEGCQHKQAASVPLTFLIGPLASAHGDPCINK